MEAFETADWIKKTSSASSGTGKTRVPHSEERLQSILATLEDCRTGLIENASQDVARVLSVTILELQLKLNRIADYELKALCDAISPDGTPAERPRDAKYSHVQRRRPLLRLVK